MPPIPPPCCLLLGVLYSERMASADALGAEGAAGGAGDEKLPKDSKSFAGKP